MTRRDRYWAAFGLLWAVAMAGLWVLSEVLHG